MIKVQIDKTQSLIDEYQNIKYFCPHCRLLFKDIHNDHKVKKPNKKYPYKCPASSLECGKYFHRSTYNDKRKNGRPYKIDKTMDMTTDEYIKSHIENLWNKGYTNRQIHTITYFSRTLIGNITKEFRDNVIDICTIEEFDKKYLSDLDNKYPLIPWRDLRTHKIRKALNLGCSVKQVAKILHKGNTTIVNTKSSQYLAEKKKNSFYHHVFPSDKKVVLTDEQLKFSTETDNFLKNAEPPITNKRSTNKNRTRITISPENEIIRIYGIGNKKK